MNPVARRSQLYLLLGDPFFRGKKLEELIKDSGGDSPPAVHSYYSWDFDPSRFIEEIQTFPFFTSKQLFILKEANRLGKAAKEILIKSLSSIPLFSTVILEAEEISKEDPLGEWVREKGNMIECRDLNPEEKDFFVKRFLEKESKSITPEALDILLERCGGSLTLLSESLNKLVLYAKDEKVVGSEIVLSLSERGNRLDGFDLINAFSQNDVARTLKIFADLYELHDTEPLEILGIFNWHFKRLWKAHELSGKGHSFQEVAKELRIPRYVWNDFKNQQKRFAREQLRVILEKLFEMDRQMKQGMVQPRHQMESFLIQFCG